MNIAELFNEMGQYSGQITSVVAIISVVILTRAVLADMLKREESPDNDE